MKFKLFIYFILFFLVACSQHEETDRFQETGNIVETISIYPQTRDMAPDANNLEPGEAESIIIDKSYFTSERSKLFISQLGTSQSPNFTNPDQAEPYLYVYHYQDNQESDWNSGYNFITDSNRKPIDWKDVKKLGSVGNTFSFYAFYFPVSEEVNFSVQTDQSVLENFKKSDILGAYHATSALYTRLRFRLFHLMVYLKVTVYVPVLKSSLTSTSAEYSGFGENALQKAYILNAYNNFTIDWRANKSSDIEAPLTQPADNPVKSIQMYKHDQSSEIITLQNINEFYPQGDYTEDEVIAYNFSVLFPAGQKFDKNFLCLQLKAPDDHLKYYYFSGDQANNSTGEFGLNQGTLQQLFLYIPRKSNETILVKSKILPWYNSSTEMTVTKKDGNAQDNNNP